MKASMLFGLLIYLVCITYSLHVRHFFPFNSVSQPANYGTMYKYMCIITLYFY